MSGINPIGNIAGTGGVGGIGSMPGGVGSLGGAGGAGGAEKGGGGSFADMLKEVVVDRPTQASNESNDLAMRFAAGENIDPHRIAVASALAGVEVQMATRTISQAVSGIRTLMQMQI